MEKPTKKYIFDRLTELKTYYSQRDTNFDLDDTYYELLFRDDLGLPEEYKEDGIVLPTARDIVDAGTNHLSTVYARFFRPVRTPGQIGIDQAEMLRKFDAGMFYRTKMDSSISPWRTAGKHGCTYGMWCFGTFYDESSVPDEPEKEDGETDAEFEERMDIYNGELHDSVPIKIVAIHPRLVYPDPGGEYVIIEATKIMAQAKRDWPQWKSEISHIVQAALGNPSNETTEVLWWDKRYRAVYLNGDPMLPGADGVVEHGYGFIPFVIGYSGLGNLDKSSKPAKMAVGLIRYLRALLRTESFAFSMRNISIKNGSWPITFVSGPGAAEFANIKLKYGKIYEKPAGMTIEEYIKEPAPEVVMEHLQYANTVLSASAAPRSVRGLSEEGVRSGTDRSLVISQARMKYDTIMEQLQLSTAKVLSNCTKIAERVVPSDIHLWAQTPDEDFDVKVEKNKIKHHYTTFVEFTPISPEEEARRHADGMNLTKVGAISGDTMRRRYLTHIDPISEGIKVEAELLRNDPAVRQVMAQIVASTLQAELARFMKVKQLQAGMLPSDQAGPPGAPSMPGGAQAMSQQMRQVPGTEHSPNVPGSPAETIAQLMQANVNKQGMPNVISPTKVGA